MPASIVVPGIAGISLSRSMGCVCGVRPRESWNGPWISKPAMPTPMKDIISVVMISFVP